MHLKHLLIAKLVGISFLYLIHAGCFVMDDSYSKLPPGPWRGVLKLDTDRAMASTIQRETRVKDIVAFEEITEGELPFNFEVIYSDQSTFAIEIINGEERIRLDEISFRHDKATNKDTLVVHFPAYDSYLEAIFEDKVLEGKWVVPSRGDYMIPFVAYHGQNHRFSTLRKEPLIDISGKWEVQFEVESENPYPAIGLFEQRGNHLTGTFQTETGDYRYLEGTVQKDKMYLSCFDGAHMFLFEAKINKDSSMSGIFRNGSHYVTSWQGKRNAEFTLKHPDSLTYVTTSEGLLDFTFPDQNGEMVSLTDATFTGKPKLVQILGTWCPNCLDESKFLTAFLHQNKGIDLAVIGLAFERYDDPIQAREVIGRYKDRLSIPYPILHAGKSDKREAGKQLPMLNRIISYPTLLFVDRSNRVKRIHTGFNGPATPDYEKFVREFELSVASLIQEPEL